MQEVHDRLLADGRDYGGEMGPETPPLSLFTWESHNLLRYFKPSLHSNCSFLVFPLLLVVQREMQEETTQFGLAWRQACKIQDPFCSWI